MVQEMDLKTLFSISYGLYIINSASEEEKNGQIANVVFQISAEPPTLATSINQKNYTHELIKKSGFFTVMILEKDTPLSFIGRFGFRSGRDMNKLEGLNVFNSPNQIPVIRDYAIGYVEVKVDHALDVETHTIFAGKIVNAVTFNQKEPMTYAYYHDVKRGTTPSSAATYQAKNNEEKTSKTSPREGMKMDKYRCTICNYEYDPANGDPDAGVKPGTSFDDLPDDWVCPICGVGKDQFEKI